MSMEAEKMKHVLTMAAILVVVATPAIAGHCPRDVKAIDEALDDAMVGAAQMSEIKAARDKGERMHKSGKHGESLKVLHEALKKLGVEH